MGTIRRMVYGSTRVCMCACTSERSCAYVVKAIRYKALISREGREERDAVHRMIQLMSVSDKRSPLHALKAAPLDRVEKDRAREPTDEVDRVTTQHCRGRRTR